MATAAEDAEIRGGMGAALAGGDDVVDFVPWGSAELAGVVVSAPYACAEVPWCFGFSWVVCVHRSCLMAAGAGRWGISSG